MTSPQGPRRCCSLIAGWFPPARYQGDIERCKLHTLWRTCSGLPLAIPPTTPSDVLNVTQALSYGPLAHFGKSHKLVGTGNFEAWTIQADVTHDMCTLLLHKAMPTWVGTILEVGIACPCQCPSSEALLFNRIAYVLGDLSNHAEISNGDRMKSCCCFSIKCWLDRYAPK